MSRNIPHSDPGVLRKWAALGATLRSSTVRGAPDWEPLRRMIEVARPKLAEDAKRLRDLLEESRKKLNPLEDPLDADFDLRRWLEDEREEAYSDWLEWVVRQAKTPARVFRLFNLGEPPGGVTASLSFEAKRECCIPHGHEDHEGRLDLVIRYGDKAIIVVEVKKGDADDADTTKHRGYNKWLAEQDYPKERKYQVLLASEAEEDAYEGFRFVSWGSLCIEMRRLAVELCREKGNQRVMTAGMVLAFVAAVEQNLLGFSAERVKAVCKGETLLFNPAVVEHLNRFINALET